MVPCLEFATGKKIHLLLTLPTWEQGAEGPRLSSILGKCSSHRHFLWKLVDKEIRIYLECYVTKGLGEVTSPNLYWVMEIFPLIYKILPKVAEDFIIVIVNLSNFTIIHWLDICTSISYPVVLFHLVVFLTLCHAGITLTDPLPLLTWIVLDVSVISSVL